MSQNAVEVVDLVKEYGQGHSAVRALDRVSLSIAENEFFTLLGPSGCGKTTLLRVLAGFEAITSGRVLLHGRDIAGMPPNKRPVNTVFQSYALFPHMTVFDNVAFALRRLRRPDTDARTRRMLELVRLAELADRRPGQLSGGQQQRVALARALAPNPEVLLLDEPLSALDLKLRQAMRIELKQIQEETGITFVFVTHDQEEALTMSDRIAVMSNGRVQQVGTARDIYEAPVNRFVADFIGESNILDVTVERAAGESALCRLGDGSAVEAVAAGGARPGVRGHLSIRPERLELTAAGQGMPCTVDRLVYLGTDTQYLVRLEDGSEVTIRTQNAHRAAVPLGPGDRAGIEIDPGAARLLAD
jgi:spermidine/putrescine transport system ATP-binding protein